MLQYRLIRVTTAAGALIVGVAAAVVGGAVAPPAGAVPPPKKWSVSESRLQDACGKAGGGFYPSDAESGYGCLTEQSYTHCDKRSNCTTTYHREVAAGEPTIVDIVAAETVEDTPLPSGPPRKPNVPLTPGTSVG